MKLLPYQPSSFFTYFIAQLMLFDYAMKSRKVDVVKFYGWLVFVSSVLLIILVGEVTDISYFLNNNFFFAINPFEDLPFF